MLPNSAGRVSLARIDGGTTARELEQERSRAKGLEIQVQDLSCCVEQLRRQADSEARKAAAAQLRADVMEEQQMKIVDELEQERQRAQRLEESFGALSQTMEQLTQTAEAAVASAPRGECPGPSRATDRLPTEEASRLQCDEIRFQLQAVCAERAELDVLQAEHNERMEQYVGRVMHESDRRADQQARIDELEEERSSLIIQQQALERQVGALAEANQELRCRLAAEESLCAVISPVAGQTLLPPGGIASSQLTPCTNGSPRSSSFVAVQAGCEETGRSTSFSWPDTSVDPWLEAPSVEAAQSCYSENLSMARWMKEADAETAALGRSRATTTSVSETAALAMRVTRTSRSFRRRFARCGAQGERPSA